MVLRRALLLSSARTTYQGDCLVSVNENILSFAMEYSTHLSRDSTSIGLIFHLFVGSLILSWNLFSCSLLLMEYQYLIKIIPDRISILSNSGHDLRNSSYSSSVQKPITFSTPALLYQLLSNNVISPLMEVGNISLEYHWVFSFSVGYPKLLSYRYGIHATGIVLITPPFRRRSLPPKLPLP